MNAEETRTLADRLKTGPLEQNAALLTAVRISLALHKAHAARPERQPGGLSPENILLCADGTVQLTAGRAELPGDSRYLAPEKRAGLPAGERGDLYTFGRVLLDMMAGPAGPEERRFHIEPSAFVVTLTNLPDGVIGVLQRCLANDPARRPGSFLEVSAALGEACQEASLTLPPDVQHEMEEAAEASVAGEARRQVPIALPPPLQEADNLFNAGEYRQALALVDRWLAGRGPSGGSLASQVKARVCLLKANAHTQLGESEPARPAYQKALVLDEQNFNAWYNWGEFLFNVDQNAPAAIDCYRKALSLQPGDAWAWNSLGYVLCSTGRRSEGLDCYDQALEIDPQMCKALGNKGVALIEMERLEEAANCFSRLTQAHPEEPLGWFYRGVIALETGDPQGEAYLQRASRLAPENIDLQFSVQDLLASHAARLSKNAGCLMKGFSAIASIFRHR